MKKIKHLITSIILIGNLFSNVSYALPLEKQ